MKTIEYDLIVIGTGSAMNIVEPFLNRNPDVKIAVIDKDEPGGICLTRGCIPTKILMYPAELIREIEKSKNFGIKVEIEKIDFKGIMNRMRNMIYEEIEMIRTGLSTSDLLDYYPETAEFIAPYTLKVGDNIIKSDNIFLCTGSKPFIPPIEGLDIGYITSDDVIHMQKLPASIIIVGGGYIAAEYGHFFSAMGSKVTVVGRNPRFLPKEEPEISNLARRELSKYMEIMGNKEVLEFKKKGNRKQVIAKDRETGRIIQVEGEEVLIAAGRVSNSDILHPEKAGIETDGKGWIKVNEYLETSQPGIWAFGDANGRYLFKHVANYESTIVYYNAILGKKIKTDYHAIPSAVFTYPEIASVGMREKEAIDKYGIDRINIGFYKYENTAKGKAMGVKDYFVKIIFESKTNRILGGHIIGPWASILIQEIIDLMYTEDRHPYLIYNGMHIHPSMSEVVERAFFSIMDVHSYHDMLREEGLE